MITRKELDLDAPLTERQKQMLEALRSIEPVPDEDCPELTAEQLEQFTRISEENQEDRIKQTVTIRLSPQAVRKAKSLGKGYTSVLSRILESALRDNETIKHFL